MSANTTWRPAPARNVPPAPGLAEPELDQPDLTEPGRRPRRIPAPQIWVRAFALVIFVLMIAATFQARPAPSPSQRLAVVILLGVLCGAFLTAGARFRSRSWVFLALLLVTAVSGAALIALGASGPGFFGIFATVAAGGLRLPGRFSGPLLAAVIVAESAAWLATGYRPVLDLVVNSFGVIAFYLMAAFGRRLRESNEQAEGMLAELRANRAAQAEAAVLAERQHLAREMHDVLAHSLSGLLINLEGARLLAASGAPGERVAETIDRAHRLAKAGLEEARDAIGMLRDEALPGPERLAGLTAEFTSDTGVPCSLTVTGEERDVGSDGRLTIYRVAQEALTNIRKHAMPDRAEVTLTYSPDGTRLTIEDFGPPGASPAPASPVPGTATAGYGLTGMCERAELLGGTLTAGPAATGFRVALWIPG